MQWTTITEFVDTETGEALTEKHIEKKLYIKIKLTTKYRKQNENYGIRKNTWQCKKNNQLELGI